MLPSQLYAIDIVEIGYPFGSKMPRSTPHSCRLQVERPPPWLQITSNVLVFMGFHMVSLLKRMVWLKILYIQESDELFLETAVFV